MLSCIDDIEVLRITAISRFFFFNDTATTEIYTLSLHDALPISADGHARGAIIFPKDKASNHYFVASLDRSEEHTSELQSPCNLVCRLLLEKKKTIDNTPNLCRSK